MFDRNPCEPHHGGRKPRGAFALGTANQVAATISVDLRTAIADGNNSVLLTLSNTDVKANVIDDLNDIGQLDVHDDLSVLPILSVDNVQTENIDALAFVDGVISIEPNRIVQTNAVDQLVAIHAEGITIGSGTGTTTLTGKGTTVGIIDAGMNANNSVFSGASGSRVVSQACVEGSTEIAPCSTDPGHAAQLVCTSMDAGCWHGNAVAAFAAGNRVQLIDNQNRPLEIGGAAPGANISFFRIATTKAADAITADEMLAGFNKFLVDTQAHSSIVPTVVNVSIGFPASSGTCDSFIAMKTAVTALVNAGVTVVAASGNDGLKNFIAAPACFSNVISVGATEFTRDANNTITGETVADYSNGSAELNVVVPGTDLIFLRQWMETIT